MSRLTFLFMAGWLLALASPAGAVTYAKFYNGTNTYSGPFSGGSFVYDTIVGLGLATNCPGGGGPCGSDVVSGSQSFSSGPGITATAN
jgi:hypothetical protein